MCEEWVLMKEVIRITHHTTPFVAPRRSRAYASCGGAPVAGPGKGVAVGRSTVVLNHDVGTVPPLAGAGAQCAAAAPAGVYTCAFELKCAPGSCVE